MTTTLGANTVCESFSGVFIGRDQHCYSILTTSAITPSSGSYRRSGMVINQEFMFTVEVYLKSYPQNTCQSIFFVGWNAGVKNFIYLRQICFFSSEIFS